MHDGEMRVVIYRFVKETSLLPSLKRPGDVLIDVKVSSKLIVPWGEQDVGNQILENLEVKTDLGDVAPGHVRYPACAADLN